MAEKTIPIPEVKIDVTVERERPRLVSLLFFDYTNSTENRKLNLLGVFDRIRVNPETMQTHPFGIFVRTGQTFDGEVNVRIIDPNGVVVAGFDFEASFPADLPADLPAKPFQSQGVV